MRACLVGRNGAGKSTLLRVLAGADRAGRRRAHRSRPAARISLVAQEPTIAGETLLDYATAGGAAAHEAEAALQALRPRSRPRDRGPVRRRGAARGAGAGLRRAAGRAAAGRADQPPRHLRHRDAGGDAGRSPRRRPDRQPRPRLPGPRHPALLLAGGPADLAAGQGLRRLRRLVEPASPPTRPSRCAGWTRRSSARPTPSTARSPPGARRNEGRARQLAAHARAQGRAACATSAGSMAWRRRPAASPASAWSRPRG